MKSFFSVDGGLYKFMTRLRDILVLNFLWLLCSIPIVTFGAATTAAYSITMKMVANEEGYIAGPFFKEFKANLKKGCPMGIMFLVAVYAMYIEFQLYHLEKGNMRTFLLIVFIVGVILIYTHFIFAFPLLSRYENGVINTLRNSHTIAIRYFMRSIFLAILLAIEFVIIFFNLTTMFVALLIGPASVILTVAANARPIFLKVEEQYPTETVPKEEPVEEYVPGDVVDGPVNADTIKALKDDLSEDEKSDD
ncbi:MAG: YesL family protein [Lachnospiraceae bacterium]|nr:YesL family protein [Lachnospiraceae bacterium]